MRIDKFQHTTQSSDSNTLSPTEQPSLSQTPDSQNVIADSVETVNPSDAFFGADDIFLLQNTGSAELKEAAGNFRSGDIPATDSKDGFSLQDALQQKPHSIGTDLPQQFTDSISSLQKNVDAALNGDASAMEDVLGTFGVADDNKTNLLSSILPSQDGSIEAEAAPSAADSKIDEWKDDFEWEGPDHDDDIPDEPDTPDEPDSSDMGDLPEPTGQDEPTYIAANDGGVDGGTSPQPDGGSTPADGGSKPDACVPDGSTEPADDGSGGGYVEPDPDLEDLEVQRYMDPDYIGTDPTTLDAAGLRFVEFNTGVKDGVRPDMDQSAPAMSPEQMPGYGTIDTTPEVDDYSSFVGDPQQHFNNVVTGDPVNPDNPINDARPDGGPPSTDPQSHND